MEKLKRGGTFLLSLVFPKMCISCNREGTHLCEDCLSLLPVNQWTFPVPASSHLSELFSAVSYEEPLARLLVHKLKYRPFLKDLSLQCAYLIGAHIAFARAEQNFSDFLICPVPLHKRRLRRRGYNHAEEIAKHLEHVLSAEVAGSVLYKIKSTAPQASLKRRQRFKNMRGAFKARNETTIRGKNILLVDDVYTTGATMEECARQLLRAGASRVFGAVVARD